LHIAERSQAPALAAPPQRRLDDMYGEDGGRTLISGIQAIVRLVLDQRRLDVLRGFSHRSVRERLRGLAPRWARP